MRRLSLQRIGESTGRTIRRFPLALFAAVVAGVAAVVLVESHDSPRLLNLVMAAQLGIPLFLAVALVSERREDWNLSRLAGPVARVVAVGLLIAYWVLLPRDLREMDWLRFAQLNVGLHLLVAVAPFARRGETRGLWQFNLTLLLRFLTAVVFSLVLYAGLSVALLALDKLLGLTIDGDFYGQLWCLIGFVFNTAYFLGGVPSRLAELDQTDTQPRVVRVFAQFILAPLVVVYLAILLAYLVKVVATGEWPSGWIGYLVSSVAVAGILSLLLLKPESEREGNRWVRIYARLFHVLMVPAVVMLALAIIKRVGQYGFTEERYFLVVLTTWLAVVVVAGCVRKRLLLKAIPATLCAVVFLTSVGPWSAYGVAHRSQLGRLEDLLADHSRLVDGVIVRGESRVGPEDTNDINRQLDYLFGHFGPDGLGDLADSDLRALLTEKVEQSADGRPAASNLARATAGFMDLKYRRSWEVDRRPGHYRFEREHSTAVRAMDVGGFDYVVRLELHAQDPIPFWIEADSCSVVIDWAARSLEVTRDGGRSLSIPVEELIEKLRAHDAEVGDQTVPDSLLVTTVESAGMRATLRLDRISWVEEPEGEIQRGTLVGQVLIGK